MGMHNPADTGKGLIKNQVGRGIARGFQSAFHHPAIQVNHHHIINGHLVVRNPAGLDHHKPFFPVDATYISPGEDNQSMFNQIQVSFENIF
jgi:hypothetical protein